MIIIKFLFISIFLLWLFRALIRAIFPFAYKNMMGDMQQQAANARQQQQSRRPEGAISIDYIPKKEKKGNADKLGDFVDFEEIK